MPPNGRITKNVGKTFVTADAMARTNESTKVNDRLHGAHDIPGHGKFGA